MISILDIDLDYFNLITNPHRRLEKLLAWADCPVTVVVENHNEVIKKWKFKVTKAQKGLIYTMHFMLEDPEVEE